MKTYRCHKEVEAAQIVGASADRQELHLDDGTAVPRPPGTNYEPALGDYFVRYTDGYVSLSPREAFESGYTLIG